MERILEFIANHPFLIGGLLLTIGLIIGYEISRFWRAAESVSAARAVRLSNSEDAVFVDARRRKDFEAGHLPGARSVPTAEVEQHVQQLEKLRERPLVFYDDGGADAQRVAKALSRHGFTRLYVLDGGLSGWRKAEMPIEHGGSSKKKKKKPD